MTPLDRAVATWFPACRSDSRASPKTEAIRPRRVRSSIAEGGDHRGLVPCRPLHLSRTADSRYTADNLIEAGCKYTIFIRGPWDSGLRGDCSFRVIPQHMVFFDGRLGLTLELSFNNQPENHPLHDRFLAMPGHKRFHPFKCEFHNVACYAAKLGTDVDGVTELTARVLETLVGCTAETDFECEVPTRGY